MTSNDILWNPMSSYAILGSQPRRGEHSLPGPSPRGCWEHILDVLDAVNAALGWQEETFPEEEKAGRCRLTTRVDRASALKSKM